MILTLKIISLLLGIIWRVYWYLMEIPANKNKPKKGKKSLFLEKSAIFIVSIFVFTQLLGFTVWSFENQLVNIIGFIIVVLGFLECMIARYNLSDNWANSYEFQIKEKQELITHGIYRYVRHPIYGGMFFMGIGMLMVAGSYTLLILAPLIFVSINYLAIREEKLLYQHFGKKYKDYMKVSKKFIPFVY